jgi:hypothetical protein
MIWNPAALSHGEADGAFVLGQQNAHVACPSFAFHENGTGGKLDQGSTEP